MTSPPPSVTSARLTAMPMIQHGFFGRQGGVSEFPYASLNAGPGSNDDPANVSENRRRIAAALSLEPASLLSVYQIHSPEVVVVSQPWEVRPEADAMVTKVPGIGLGILTADCAPVLFFDPVAQVIGAAHAGWKGAVRGVLENTLVAMQNLGAALSRVEAVIGPTIQQHSYEVAPDFRDQVLEHSPFAHALFVPGQSDRWLFDLPGYCRMRLERVGVMQVETLPNCTCAEEEMFFSNRRAFKRSEPDYGRNCSVIALMA